MSYTAIRRYHRGADLVSMTDVQAYEQSALYKEIVAPLQPFFVGEYRTYRCEVKYSEEAK